MDGPYDAVVEVVGRNDIGGENVCYPKIAAAHEVVALEIGGVGHAVKDKGSVNVDILDVSFVVGKFL